MKLVRILEPFAEVTQLNQGDSYATIGCVVPSVVALGKCLKELSDTVQFHGSLVSNPVFPCWA